MAEVEAMGEVGVTATAVMGPAVEAVTTEAATAAAGADTELTPVMGSRIIEAGSCSVSVIGL